MARRDVARDDRPMRVETTDRSRICDLVVRRLAADPVRGTVLGSILADTPPQERGRGYRAVADRAVVIVG